MKPSRRLLRGLTGIRRNHRGCYDSRRVVITGVGGVTPLGMSIQESWRAILQGRSAVRPILEDMEEQETRFVQAYQALPSRIAARVPLKHFKALQEEHFSSADLRAMSKAMVLSILATDEALRDADVKPTDVDDEANRIGVAVGNAMVDLDFISDCHNLVMKGSINRLSPYFVPRILPNLAPGHISIRYGFRGPNHSVSTACATGSHAIGDAFNFIKTNAADVMVAGASDTCINPLSMAGFCRARALSTKFNDTPSVASRPFDQDRDGFVMGEGAGILILEELQHALQRGARIYCEVLGLGMSGDAYHITSGRPDGEGALTAMLQALNYLDATDDYKFQLWCINAHATSTPVGDKAELTAIAKLLQNDEWSSMQLPADGRVMLTSHKGNIGHLMGACGAVETAFAAMALHFGVIPPTMNVQKPDPMLDVSKLNILTDIYDHPVEDPNQYPSRKLVLKNSFGFGGTNVSLLLAEFKL